MRLIGRIVHPTIAVLALLAAAIAPLRLPALADYRTLAELAASDDPEKKLANGIYGSRAAKVAAAEVADAIASVASAARMERR